MSNPCETVEALGIATSECPATDIIMVQSNAGNGSSAVMPGITQQLQTGSASGTSQVTIDAYAWMTSTGSSSSTVSPTVIVTSLLVDAAQGASTLFAAFNQMTIAAANAEDEIAAMDIPQLLISAAQATSILTANSVAVFAASEIANATSMTSLGLVESLTSSATSSSMVVLLRRVNESVTSSASGASDVVTTGMPQTYLLLSSGEAASLVMLQSDHTLLIEASAEATSDVWFKDPARVAWVMNTETTAANWYDNFDFESIAQPPGKVLAVGPDGLYELTGSNDSGEQIDAAVTSGFNDFGTGQTKHVENMFFGYTSEGTVQVTVETYESGHPPSVYSMDYRLAYAPRNGRVVPGKGLFGRYWRMTIRNENGADFEIHDASVDIAVSSRRL